MPYTYETHMHTCQGSACGVSTGKEQARYYKEIGYTGIIITDHFFHGNTAVRRDLPWKERIELFFKGYEDAREEGEKIGLDVFFGYEQHFVGDEYLIYGLDKAYMMAHPEMEHWTRRQQMEEVHKAGGCLIQAHPFRMRSYMEKIRLGAQFCDGIEAANAGNDAVEDARAIRFGRELGLLMTAGSDNHHSPAKEVYGVTLERRLTCIRDYVDIILKREPIVLAVPEERFRWDDSWTLDDRHVAYALTDQEETILSPKQWFG